jgi:hypothetical protein
MNLAHQGAIADAAGFEHVGRLGLVNVVYFMRAKTEEKHLMADPDYQAYSAWIAEHGLIPRALRRLSGKRQASTTAPQRARG